MLREPRLSQRVFRLRKRRLWARKLRQKLPCSSSRTTKSSREGSRCVLELKSFVWVSFSCDCTGQSHMGWLCDGRRPSNLCSRYTFNICSAFSHIDLSHQRARGHSESSNPRSCCGESQNDKICLHVQLCVCVCACPGRVVSACVCRAQANSGMCCSLRFKTRVRLSRSANLRAHAGPFFFKNLNPM